MSAFIVSAGTFEACLKSAVGTIKSMRGKIQALLVFACEHYAETGNTQYITAIQATANTTRGLHAHGIQRYVQAVCNVVWTKGKDGAHVYKKTAPADDATGPNVATCDTETLKVAFYDWLAQKGIGNAKPDWTVEKAAIRVLADIRKNAEKGASVDSFVETLRKLSKVA